MQAASQPHAIVWECEGRRLSTSLTAPKVDHWPAHLRLRGLVTKNMDADPFDLLCLQQYVTTTLIERRADEKAIRVVGVEGHDIDQILEARPQHDPTTDGLLPTPAVGVAAASTGAALGPQDEVPLAHVGAPGLRQRPTGARAASSTDPMPELQLPRTDPPISSIAILDSDEEHTMGSTADAVSEPPAKKRRQTWQGLKIPAHIVECQDLLAQKM
eukprot:1407491-Amphidinium_carterae.1